jgi:hypothetical protein
MSSVETSKLIDLIAATRAEEAATRADLAAIDIPGFHDFIPPTKGRT